ncbi:response regulator transcription factor [Actinotalea sp. C106]|uniref:response regulator n=1 Tax=Actinotalea sp. C106 TaxID=2908644 RepID=UPI002027E090|nr:response regulator transcription factor [Actinotalea sp. C106]
MTGEAGSIPSDAPSSIKVLLVDDQELFREGVRVIVDAQPGMHVVGTAADGHQAVRMAAELHPDVVLMDLQMPVVDGVEATRRLLAPDLVAGRTAPLRVVVLTTFDLDDRAATAIRHGASGFLLKTTTPVQLADAIRTVHAGNAVLAPHDLIALLDNHRAPRDELPRSYQRLTEKERDVLVAVARGLSNAEMAQEFFLAESTIKTHVGAVLRKLGLRDRVQVVVFAHRHGLT